MILAPLLSALCAPVIAPDTTLRGRYVEARTASVFAGACHYSGERTTDGREALLAWSVAAGTIGGVDCSGAAVALAVADEGNLADTDRARSAVVYVPSRATGAQRAALVTWLRRDHAALVGDVRAVHVVDLDVRVQDDAFSLIAPGVFALTGDALPDRACCRMPYQVWYEPLVPLAGPLVGRTREFTLREPALDLAWSRPGENAAFFGRFGPAERSLAH